MSGNQPLGCSDAHLELLSNLSRVARTDAEILTTGPSGVGKGSYARFVHRESIRDEAAFVPINFGALPAELVENQLFGHVSGAFTGARPKSDCLISAPEGGTLFFGEIDTLANLYCQFNAKFLLFAAKRACTKSEQSITQSFLRALNTLSIQLS